MSAPLTNPILALVGEMGRGYGPRIVPMNQHDRALHAISKAVVEVNALPGSTDQAALVVEALERAETLLGDWYAPTPEETALYQRDADREMDADERRGS